MSQKFLDSRRPPLFGDANTAAAEKCPTAPLAWRRPDPAGDRTCTWGQPRRHAGALGTWEAWPCRREASRSAQASALSPGEKCTFQAVEREAGRKATPEGRGSGRHRLLRPSRRERRPRQMGDGGTAFQRGRRDCARRVCGDRITDHRRGCGQQGSAAADVGGVWAGHSGYAGTVTPP